MDEGAWLDTVNLLAVKVQLNCQFDIKKSEKISQLKDILLSKKKKKRYLAFNYTNKSLENVHIKLKEYKKE